MRLGFPRVAQAPHVLAKTHGEVNDGMQPLGVYGGQAIAVSQQKLGIAEDSRKRIVDFVPEYLRNIAGQFGPRRPQPESRPLGPAQPPLDQGGGVWNEVAHTHHELDVAFRQEPRELRLARIGIEKNNRSSFSQLAERFGNRSLAQKHAVHKYHARRDLTQTVAQLRKGCNRADRLQPAKPLRFGCEFLRKVGVRRRQHGAAPPGNRRSSPIRVHSHFFLTSHSLLSALRACWTTTGEFASAFLRLRSRSRFTAIFSSSTRNGFARYGTRCDSRNSSVRGPSVSPVMKIMRSASGLPARTSASKKAGPSSLGIRRSQITRSYRFRETRVSPSWLSRTASTRWPSSPKTSTMSCRTVASSSTTRIRPGGTALHSPSGGGSPGGVAASFTTGTAVTGSSTMNLAPALGWLSNITSPPCCFTIPYTIESPNPVPTPEGLVVKKGSKMRHAISSGMPGPSSEISREIRSEAVWRVRIRTCP